MQNGTGAVSIIGNGGQAQFSTVPYNGDMNAYISAVFRSVAGDASISPGAIQRTTVIGIPASWSTARVNRQSGLADVTVFASEFPRGQAFCCVARTRAARGSVFTPLFGCVRRLGSAEATGTRPRS